MLIKFNLLDKYGKSEIRIIFNNGSRETWDKIYWKNLILNYTHFFFSLGSSRLLGFFPFFLSEFLKLIDSLSLSSDSDSSSISLALSSDAFFFSTFALPKFPFFFIFFKFFINLNMASFFNYETILNHMIYIFWKPKLFSYPNLKFTILVIKENFKKKYSFVNLKYFFLYQIII